MDLQKIGIFLAQLRKEQGLTQEQLGDQIGVTNKTISRWEKGNYLPPAQMLQILSELYGVSINEILSGERLAEETYQKRAEENIRSALEGSSFTLEETIRYFKKKWKREHFLTTVLVVAGLLAVYWYGLMEQRGWNSLAMIGVFVYLIIRRNQMMIYVENHVYGDGKDSEIPEPSGEKLLRCLRILLLASLAVSVLVLVDLGDNLLFSMIPELNDGITIRGSFSQLFFGDDGWSRAACFQGFSRVLRITGWLAAGNLMLSCVERMNK